MTAARKNLIDPASTPYYHCMARCVRRAFLCGKDDFSGKNYEHRRQWVIDRLKELSEVFAIEICAYAVMSNHYHVVLHINRKQCEQWGDREVLERWTRLFSGHLLVQRFLANDKLGKAELQRVEAFAEEYRRRLLDISWFMRCLNEYLAREANKEDGCKGRFWEGRYKSQALLDEAALLTCMAYVDLNPVRAKMARTPETSDYTSVKERAIQARGNAATKQVPRLKSLRSQGQKPDQAIPFALSSYLELVDWSGRIVRQDKKGRIPADIPPILERLKIDPDEWLKAMCWNNRFRRAVGKLASLKAYAEKTGRQWVHGVSGSQSLYLQ
ncbi:transposase [Endozoicomonas numazuensis]|uniref:Transposase n=1 Tax=Endozoicomonas numazuensis TaxID=1137799 RepID=A0A081NEN7_9GAMM|nr:transposase [Endozoicomonas numazuensis]KEQ16910.1 transposase [Endozoicomonas numazuensis]